ncbi:MAG TPA: hypothetical protein VG146_05820 [Verrucomicrobiae bacterium]|nr:hypothetical protein [Verrucomicrobiae bacterium]
MKTLPASLLSFPESSRKGSLAEIPQPGKRTLLLGFGNDLLADDAIGLRIAATLPLSPRTF